MILEIDSNNDPIFRAIADVLADQEGGKGWVIYVGDTRYEVKKHPGNGVVLCHEMDDDDETVGELVAIDLTAVDQVVIVP